MGVFDEMCIRDRKYGVDYAVKKDRSSSPPKYLIFFKGDVYKRQCTVRAVIKNKDIKKRTTPISGCRPCVIMNL